ncbi:MAG TPA: hypothetical protein VEH82_03515 [Acidimicrobiales bacterium]|nr:hypothetical protein [Acidimicrobiales bacterium]
MPRRYLQFEFEVGEKERHLVTFRFDPLFGPLDIFVDGRPVVARLDTFSVRRVQRFGFAVGRRERHDVLIEKTRKRVVGGLLPQECKAYVDGKLVGRFTNSTANARATVRAAASAEFEGDTKANAVRAPSKRTLATRRAAPGPLPS